ncbi:sulfite exporter TauE/SafE family protein [Duganella qianjiadongensis]|uniref:Probable membrane transporter protein n=1 Tax=Duganella qianjiadongensis TaxID=2692176 RepID=A0ABW9VHB7_9BURK|nr:sulfite exporter TauE/SafE family protein [Duganella qianjiadongensis]MYM38562.1 TSUP family transporter [Duganella qianjiadongensis]
MSAGLILLLLLMGAFGGFAAGMLGIGGGMILVPFITMIFTAQGFAPHAIIHMAVATSLGVIMFTSLSSVRAHHQHGAVLWPVAALLAPGILLGAWCGPWIAKQLSSSGQAMLFAVFLTISATQILFGKKAPAPQPVGAVPQTVTHLPSRSAMFGTGMVIGVISGLVGAGGGFLSVPFLMRRGVPIHNAVATSAALGFPIALSGTLSNIYYGWQVPDLPPYALGFVYVPALAVMALASVSMAPFGARAAHRLPVQTLKKIFAVMLYCLAAYMLNKALN